ncbi:FtsK/SpoIIIE domain-containing protein [Paramaledivibacter caminithermalis]|uniref:FtsK/SpoIIIE family protein n=1 Tax=Paramaledivibacter caminithermalis (strain DSM 15212 / CIP 107654 / DViRD3) TaxID=1121301 RepID=A0A1M6SS51_PARC5|nr:FtsK/SpoIIIE domain-containing protein [Paramaledivibacter caminithermalis]SHK47477.1 FtsK/SpoIIIE family protein [Paramaledivibacter caminithermalis DSM 15212]
MANRITDEQIGAFVIGLYKGTRDFIKSFFYGLGELIFHKKNGKSHWGLVGFCILLIICGFAFCFAKNLIEYIPKSKSEIGAYFRKPVFVKCFALFLVVFYIKAKGDDRLKFLNSFDEKFEAVGLYSRLVRERIDSKGKKVKVKDYPKLLKEIKNGETTIYLFSSNGIPISEWRKKIDELESTMDRGILSVENKKNSRSIVKMVTVPFDKKAERQMFDEKFERLGLYTKLDNIKCFPQLLETKKEEKKVIYRFSCDGIPVTLWKDKRDSIESMFNTNIVKIRNEKDTKNIVELVTVPLKYNIKEAYPWKDEYIPVEDFEVSLGEGLLERVKLNFNSTPHVLIGGLTGSGKSVLERSIVWQVIKKGAKTFLIDFKGGVELGAFEDFGEVVFERKRVVQILDNLVKEHHARIAKFKELEVKNITEYNKKAKVPLARIFLIVDEVAELLDSTGASKEEKILYEAIQSSMNTLARLSRATGINMILATQRPDAKVLNGQIKNNLGARISGRMTDKEPSMMILGSPDAIKLPEETKGRFLFSLGAEPVEIQGYHFKDSHIVKGNYEKGIMLTSGEKLEIKSNVEIIDDEKYYNDDEEMDSNAVTEAAVEEIDIDKDDGLWVYDDDVI